MLPDCPGTYLLCLESRVDREIAVGRLGHLHLTPGFYLYVGSALGPGGLRTRVGRHARRHKTKRWHIDYLRTHVSLREVWYSCGEERREGAWSHHLAELPGAVAPWPGFGASDCPGEEHLFRFDRIPRFEAFAEAEELHRITAARLR